MCIFATFKAGKRGLTIDSDLAVTVTVTSGEESLGLLVGECSGGGNEVLQEQPDRWYKRAGVKMMHISDCVDWSVW